MWVKNSGGQGSLYRSQHEFVFVFKNGKTAHRNNIQLGQYGRYRTNVWNYRRVNSLSRSMDEGSLCELHPTINKAASGDGQSMRYLCQLVASAEEPSVAVEPAAQFPETDQRVMDNIMKRFQNSFKDGNDETDAQ